MVSREYLSTHVEKDTKHSSGASKEHCMLIDCSGQITSTIEKQKLVQETGPATSAKSEVFVIHRVSL